MSEYRRPALPGIEYVDATGEPIPYGTRWDQLREHGEGPPEEAYSVVTHPERFSGLGSIGEALIGWLSENFAVTVTDGGDVDYRSGRRHYERSVRVDPGDPDAAPLVFYLNDDRVEIRPGLFGDYSFPVCSCDACDDDVEYLATELEDTVFAVIEGRYRESLNGPVGRGLNTEITGGVGSASDIGSAQANVGPGSLSRAELRAVRTRLKALPDGRWQAWPVL